MRLSERMNKVVLFSSMYADKVAKLEADKAALYLRVLELGEQIAQQAGNFVILQKELDALRTKKAFKNKGIFYLLIIGLVSWAIFIIIVYLGTAT